MFRIKFGFCDSDKTYTTEMMSAETALEFTLGAFHSDVVIHAVEKHMKSDLADWEVDILMKSHDSEAVGWKPITF